MPLRRRESRCMNHDDPRGRYDTAMQKLSELICQRDGFLQDLDAMCVHASGASAQHGLVAAFDVERARRIIKRIARQNSQIARTMATVNKYAAAPDEPSVGWRRFDSGAGAEASSAA